MNKAPSFIGLETDYPIASGERIKRLHMDGAASPLAATSGLAAIKKLLPHYSNTHSYVHNSAQISTKALAWAHDMVLKYLGAKQGEYVSVFLGAGTTAAINRVARGLSLARPDRKRILVSSMEHHANDLPHRQFGNEVIYIPLLGEGAHAGAIDLKCFETLCTQHSQSTNYVAISSVSNVTGICNPVKEICDIAHQHDIFVLVDGAQGVAHGPTELSDLNADFFVFSGHKVYAPMSPGVLVAKSSVLRDLSGQDLGGGSVSTVSLYDFELLDNFPDREESGTPNIIGAIALASVLDELRKYGLDNIQIHDTELSELLLSELLSIERVTVYADTKSPRTGAIAFNMKGVDHGLLAAILNDYYGIAVRNECFCAHPYVSSLLKEELWQLDLSDIDEDQQQSFINRKRGMVRASLSLYNTKDDVLRLIEALSEIPLKIAELEKMYLAQEDGSYEHQKFQLDWREELGL